MNASQSRSLNSNGSRIMLLPEELVVHILSYLSVKSLMLLKCTSKAWNTLISYPEFVKLHLQQSKKNRNLKLIMCMSLGPDVLPLPLHTILKNPSIIRSAKRYCPSNPEYHYKFIGSCNGIFCFFVYTSKNIQNSRFQLWNPATNTSSNIFEQHLDSQKEEGLRFRRFSFGYDYSTDTYKILYFGSNKLEIFSFGCNDRKIIQLPHMVPLNHLDCVPGKRIFLNEDVYLNDTIYLLVRNIAKKIVIISLNLSTYTYGKLHPPQDFVEVSFHLPTLHVLEDSLYFSQHTQETHFIIWKMTEFGIEKSWTQFLKISYQDLNIHIQYKYFLAPLCLYESGVALVQAANSGRTEVILYNWRGNIIKKTRMDNFMSWMFNQNYVESLAPT